MANGKTYGIAFPFRDSLKGDYLALTETPEQEIRSNLIHLLLTRKGSRYFLPDFGTRLYEYIFEPLDGPTFGAIRAEIQQAVDTYIPNLRIDNIEIIPLWQDTETFANGEYVSDQPEYKIFDIYRTAGQGVQEYTAKVKISFTITSDAFETKDFVILNI
jgi:phage baseplate assembly protein W